MSGRRGQTQMLDEKPARGKCLTGVCIIWKVLTCLVSHITLVLLVVCYCVGGAYLFQHLEKPHEIEVKKGIQNIRYGLTDRIWKFSDNTSVLSESDWVSNVEKDLISFEKQILTAMKSDGWDGDEDITKTQWTFAGSLFYSIIVITTIGYGHISPHTDWGKVTTIFYAIMGIPLMLLCLSNIGDVMATSFRFIYWRVCCYVCTRKSRPRHRSRQRTMQPYRYSGHRSQPPSLRRSSRRRGHDPYDMEDPHHQHGLQHAHSDPELRNLAQRDFEISRQELRESKRSKHADIYEHDYPYDARRCPWDCACHRDHAEPRHHRRIPTSRYSTRSERWTHSMMYEEEFEQDRQPRYSYSLPRGRHSSRRLRAKTVDPRYSEYRQCPYAQYHHHHHRNAAVVPTHYDHHMKSQPLPHEANKISHCQHHQQVAAGYEDPPKSERPVERVRKTPIITKGYTIEELPQEESYNPAGIKKKLRSHSMPRATHLHPRDALYIPVEEEQTGRRLRRSRAMSVMPRHSGGYSGRGVENYELNDLRTSSHSTYKNAECTDCCLHERNDYRYATEPPEKVMAPPPRGSYNSHTSYQGRQSAVHDYGHRRSRKPVRHERAEKLPPSPRIMSPMGFAVKRQTRQRPSFEYDEDSLNGWHENYDDMTVKNRPVPIWLCVFLVISYILGGAVLFAYWEQWSFLDSAYFCFITLTTIGFGDFVPAKGVKDESEQSIAYCSLYLLFGIALLAMSFNLVQEEFIANVKEIARRLGIIKDEEDENE